MSVWVGLLICFALLLLGTVSFFLIVDADSHSASDTLRPFLLTMVPVWVVAVLAARIVLRSKPR